MADMDVEVLMDMDSDSEREDEDVEDGHDDEDPPRSTTTSPLEECKRWGLPDEPVTIAPITASDPRRRPPSGDQDLSNGWDPHDHELRRRTSG